VRASESGGYRGAGKWEMSRNGRMA